MKKLLIILALLHQTVGADTTKTKGKRAINVAEVKNVKKKQSLVDSINEKATSAINQTNVNAKINLLDFRNFGVSTSIGVNKVSHEIASHDANKLYNGLDADSWHEFLASVTFAVPAGVEFEVPGFPIGVSIHQNTSIERGVRIQVPEKELVERDNEYFWQDMETKIKESVEATKSIKIFLDSEDIIKEYPPGTLIEKEGVFNVVGGAGLSLISPIAVSASSQVFASTTDRFKITINRLFDEKPDAKLMKVRIQKIKAKGGSWKNSIKFGTTLFNVGSIEGVLKVDLLAHTKSKSKNSSIEYEFIYDLNFPEARKAFDKAIDGNLVLSEKAGKFRFQEKEYKGILIMGAKNENIKSINNHLRFGPHFADTEIDFSISSTGLDEDNGGLYSYSTTNDTVRTTGRQTDYTGESSQINKYEYILKKKLNILFGWIESKSIEAKMVSDVSTLDVVNENGDHRKIDFNKVEIDFQLVSKRAGRNLKKFFESAKRTIAYNNPGLQELIGSIEKNDFKCGKQAQFDVKVKLYDRAINNIINANKRDLWVAVGKMFDFKIPAKLRYEKSRNRYIAELKAELAKIRPKKKVNGGKFKRYTQKQQVARKYIQNRLRAMDMFDELINELSEFKSKISNFQSQRDDIAKYFREVFKTKHKDFQSFLLTSEFFIMIANMNIDKNETETQGVYMSYKFDSEKCKYAWYQISNKLFLH